MSPTGASNRRWACETWAKAGNIFDFFSFVLYSPTRASAGSPIRDLRLGREVALCCIGRSCLAAWEFCPARRAPPERESLHQRRKREAPGHWEGGVTPVDAPALATAATPALAGAEASDTAAADGASPHDSETMADVDGPAVAPARPVARRTIDIPKSNKKGKNAASGSTLEDLRTCARSW